MERASHAAGSIIGLLARSEQLADLVIELRRRATTATGATASALLALDPRTGRLRETTGTPGEATGPEWALTEGEASQITAVLSSGRLRQIVLDSTTAPEIALRMGTAAAVLAPIVNAGRPLGMLVLGLPAAVPPLEWSQRVAECADAIGLALVRTRLRDDTRRQHELHALVLALGRSGAPAIAVERFGRLCGDIARVLLAGRVELWLHDRRGRRIDRVVTSDTTVEAALASVLVSEPGHFVAETLRHPRARILDRPAGPARSLATVAAPILGRRRALGVLLLEQLHLPAGESQQTLDQIDNLTHELAGVIESTQLLDDVMRTRRELENTFDSLTEQVFVCEHDGRVSHANLAVAQRLNRPRTELIGQSVAAMVAPPVAAWIASLLDKPTDGSAGPPERRSAEFAETIADRAVTVTVTVTPLADGSPSRRGSVIVVRDVSDERRLIAEQAALRERLARSEAMGHLVAGIAHELNNPLQAVLGHVELLQRGPRLAAPVASGLRHVYRESDRAARIVRNLLVLAGSGQVARRPVSVNAAVGRALALRAVACRGASIRITRRLSDELPKVPGDAVLLQQAFLNLILNAEQALEGQAGGIEVRSTYIARRKCVRIEIRDSGPGIAADVLPRIFDPFFTTKDTGSGLGLAMTLRIIREHGGDIVAACGARGKGAIFAVELPAASPSKR